MWKAEAEKQRQRALESAEGTDRKDGEATERLAAVTQAKLAAETDATTNAILLEQAERTIERLTREVRGYEDQLMELAMNPKDADSPSLPRISYYSTLNPYSQP